MTGGLFPALIASTVLMLFVLLVRRPVTRLFGARLAYALWALPAIRLLLPPLPGWTPVFAPDRWLPSPSPVAVEMVAVPADALPAAGPAVADAPDLLAMLAGVWAVGALLWFGWQLLRYHRFLHLLMADARLLTRTGGTDVLISRQVDGPMAAGVMWRRILLPADFRSRYAPAEQRLALLHEAAHHDRGDLIANFAGLAVVAAHWWNPVAHLAYRAFRADQELACDATVLAGETATARGDYAAAVLKSACLSVPSAACAMNHKAQLKQRIVMMHHQLGGIGGSKIGRATALLLGGSALLLTAAGAAPPPAPPAAPAPSLAPAAPAAPARVAAPAALGAPSVPAGAAPARVIVIKRQHDGDKEPPAADKPAVSVMTIPAGEGRTIDTADTGIVAELAGTIAEIEGQKRDARVIALQRTTCRQTEKGGDRIIICDNADPINISMIRRDALQSARDAIARTEGLTDSQRRAALEGIDKAMADIDKVGRPGA